MTQHREPSLLEYARFYGVSVDHLAANPFDLITPDLQRIYEGNSTTENTPRVDFSFPEPPLEKEIRNEKLEIGRDGARFLSNIIKDASTKTTNPIDWDTYLPKRRRVRSLKADELPLLKTVHELDMASLGHERITLDPATLKLPLEKTQDENDEGSMFLKDFWELPGRVLGKVKTEKLDCTRDAFMLIQEARRSGDHFTNDIRDEFYECALSYAKKREELQPISPPLLPRETPFTLYIPSSPTAKVPLLSGPESPLVPELAEVENRLLNEDSLSLPLTTSDSQNKAKEMVLGFAKETSTDLLIDSLSSVEYVRQRQQNFHCDKMNDEIVTPPGSAKIDSVQTAKILEENNMDNTDSNIEADYLNTAGEMLDDHLVEVAYDALQEVDTATKADLGLLGQIPIANTPDLALLSITYPRHPACSTANDSLTVQDTCTLPGHHIEIEEPSSSHDIFPEKSNADEVLVCQSYQSTDTVANTNSMEDDPVETLQDRPSEQISKELSVKESKDSNYLLSGTPNIDTNQNIMRNEDSGTVISKETGDTGNSQKVQRQRKRKNRTPDTSGKDLKRASRRKKGCPAMIGQGDSPLSSVFSALGSLSSFMETRGKVSRKSKERSSYFSTSSNNGDATLEYSPQIQHINDSSQEEVKGQEIETVLEDNIATIPTLNNKPQRRDPLTLILSTSLLKADRHLVRYLENLTPSPTLIFRDYDKFLHTDRHFHSSHGISIKQNGHHTCAPTEADIIISPSTGIILTTSQATTQLYLPGYKPQYTPIDGFPKFDSPLRERIARACVRYERIYVLISHSQTSTTKLSSSKGSMKVNMTIDPKTLSSIRSLMAFCASLSEHSMVIPLLVPSSQSMEWILSLANRYVFQHGLVPKNIGLTPINRKKNTIQTPEAPPPPFLQEEETAWELFLRQIGLNPFAAQAVLAITKLEEHAEELISNNSHYPCASGSMRRHSPGLSSFIEMDPQRRRHLFGDILGEKVLKRVESLIERWWHTEEILDLLL